MVYETCVQVVLTANENEDYLIKILLRQTRRPEVTIIIFRTVSATKVLLLLLLPLLRAAEAAAATIVAVAAAAAAAATLDNYTALRLMPRKTIMKS